MIPESGGWKFLSDMVTPRNNHQMATLNGILTVMGGYGGPLDSSPKDLDTIEDSVRLDIIKHSFLMDYCLIEIKSNYVTNDIKSLQNFWLSL